MTSWAKPYVGIAWETMDCWALVKDIQHKHFGRNLSVVEYSILDPKEKQWEVVDRCKVDWFKVDVPVYGDIILFNFLMGRPHVGVCLSSTEFIHSTRYAGVCVERLNAPRWKRRIQGYYRHSSCNSS